jgi:hypothetical protein
MSPLAHTPNKNPGSGFRRAGAKYFNFDWHQSYDQNINFTLGTQAR